MTMGHEQRKWTPEEVAELKRLRERGLSFRDIAGRLGRSPGSVENKHYQLNLPKVRKSTRSLADAQLKWLDKHYKHTANSEIAARMGISKSSVIRLARLRGLVKSRQFIRKKAVEANRKAVEANKRRGWPPKGYVIPNQRGFEKGKGVWALVSEAKAKEMRRKSVESRAATFAKEKSRVVWGLPQKTNLRIGRQPVNKVQYRYRLRRYGYVEDAEDRNLFRYGPDLKRHLEVEERAHARHRIRFMPIEDEAEEADEGSNQDDAGEQPVEE